MVQLTKVIRYCKEARTWYSIEAFGIYGKIQKFLYYSYVQRPCVGYRTIVC